MTLPEVVTPKEKTAAPLTATVPWKVSVMVTEGEVDVFELVVESSVPQPEAPSIGARRAKTTGIARTFKRRIETPAYKISSRTPRLVQSLFRLKMCCSVDARSRPMAGFC